MPTNKTNKELLKKGVTRMVSTVLLLFLGPVIIHSSFKNQDNPLFYPVLIAGIAICVLAVILAFRGLQTIMSALFNDQDKTT